MQIGYINDADTIDLLNTGSGCFAVCLTDTVVSSYEVSKCLPPWVIHITPLLIRADFSYGIYRGRRPATGGSAGFLCMLPAYREEYDKSRRIIPVNS